jgi:hypothetical protein
MSGELVHRFDRCLEITMARSRITNDEELKVVTSNER